ncbi:hypothetical protein KAR91_67835 [Candidatus Pacearchaeota archaeon]|nr:hypothetical protein [Candidatus Pacearchaeota archaeon]
MSENNLDGDQTNHHPRAFEGVYIPEDIWTHPDLTWIEKCIVAEISSLDNPEKEPRGCFKSNENFAKEFGIKVRQFQNILSKLKKMNLVQSNGSNGRKRWLLGYRRIRQIAVTLQGSIAPQTCNELHPSHAIHYQNSVIPVKPPLLRVKKKKKEKEKASSDALVISDFLFSLIKKNDKGIKKCTSTINIWAEHIDKIINLDNRHPEEIREVIEFGMGHHFWCTQINDGKKLRKNFNNASMAMKAPAMKPAMTDSQKARKRQNESYLEANPNMRNLF